MITLMLSLCLQEEVEAILKRAQDLERAKRFEEALEDYTRAIELQPDLARAYQDRARVRRAVGDEDGARQDLDRAMRLNPDLRDDHRRQDEFAARLAELRREMDLAEDEETRTRLASQIAELEEQMRRGHPGSLLDRWRNLRGPDSKKQEEETVAALTEISPEFAAELKRLKESSPDEYRERIMQFGERVRMLRETQKRDPAMGEIILTELKAELAIARLTSELRGEGHVDREAAAKQLKTAVTDLFDARIKMREREVKELEQRMKEVRDRIDKQKANKDSIIEQRVAELTGKRGDLEFP
jgi:tetratricopeptide (TPR) repeat protein